MSSTCDHEQPERGRLYCWVCGLPLWWRPPLELQPAHVAVGKPPGGDWEYLLWP